MKTVVQLFFYAFIIMTVLVIGALLAVSLGSEYKRIKNNHSKKNK